MTTPSPLPKKFVAILVGRTQDGGISGYCMEAQETKPGAGLPSDPDAWETVVRSYRANQLTDLQQIVCIDDAQMEVYEVHGDEFDQRDEDLDFDQHYDDEKPVRFEDLGR